MLADGLTNEQAVEIEKQYIAKHKLRRDGGSLVNLTYGGEFGKAGYKMSAEEIRAHSERVKGNKNWLGKKHSEETKSKMALAATGRIKGEAEKLKLSVANTGLKRSQEIKDKISKGHTGLKQSEEAKEKGRVAKLGILNPNYGKKTWNFGIPRTEECKRKIRDTKAARKKIV